MHQLRRYGLRVWAHGGALIFLFIVTGCSSSPHIVTPQEGPVAVVHSSPQDLLDGPSGWEKGIATWYGRKFHGRRTASGERYDRKQLTAAHRSLPFGSWVEVRSLSSGKRVRVRITDRGPFVKGRMIDVSEQAARELGFLLQGKAEVEIRLVPAAEAFLDDCINGFYCNHNEN